MQCQSCGTALQPGAVACPSCGTPISSAPSDFSSYESSGSTVPFIDYRPFVETSSVSSSQQSSPHPQPSSYPLLYTNPQFYPAAPPFPEHTIQQFGGAVQQPPPGQQQRGGLSAGMIALFIILALLLVAAGSGLTYYIIAIRLTQRQAQATTVLPAISTTQTSTNAPYITATNPQDLYIQATSGTPALDTASGSQSASDWQAPAGLGNCTLSGTTLRAAASQELSICLDRATNFDNFAYQAQVTIIQGDDIGLFFRTDTIGEKAYFFIISSDGNYGLALLQGSRLSSGHFKILVGADSTAINTGLNQPNLLTVIARGSTIYLYVNKQYLTSVSDSTSNVGMIGVTGLNTTKGPVDVAFSQIQVWKL